MLSKRLLTQILLIAILITGIVIFNTDNVLAADSNLSWGSRGDAVVVLQKTLNNQGYWCGTVDGILGAKTYAAVKKYQKANGIPATGTVGPLTRKALGIDSSNGSNATVSRGGTRTIRMLATGYCACAKCNFPYGGQPSYLGYPLGRGIVAVDPDVIPMGSRLYIEGYGSGIAADQGNAIKGNHIDLFFDSHQEALSWGMKTVSVTIY